MEAPTNDLISIDAKNIQYNTARLKYEAISSKAQSDFIRSFHSYFSNIDEVHNNCSELATTKYFLPAIHEAIGDLIALGIYDMDSSFFCENYLSSHLTWEDDFQVIDDKYLEITLATEELDAYRAARREQRGRMIGGGLGLSGAIKGAAQAAAINAVTGIAHGTWNLGAKAISSISVSIKKDALFKESATKEDLALAIYNGVFSVFVALTDAANDQKPGSISGLIAAEDADKAKRILDNIEQSRLPNTEIKEALQKAISLDPYNESSYRIWVGIFGDADLTLNKTAVYFGREKALDQAKNKLFQTETTKLKLNSISALDNNAAQLNDYAISIGFQGAEKEIHKIRALLTNKDKEDRTFNGNVYETKGMATEAKLDINNRTHKGKIYESIDLAEVARNKKSVGIFLGTGIFFAPYIFSFFTLRKGYSPLTRAIALIWMAFVIYFFSNGKS